MEKITANDPEARSADLVADNIARLKALFPELVTEGKDGAAVNIDVLKQLVGDATVTDAEEKYGLNWHGKRRARQLALTPSLGTLRPCPEDSVDWDTTQNLMIEGDNLEVLKLLQKSYAGKVKLIYIDPPYNTGKEFVYPDNFHDSIKHYLELTGRLEGGRKVSSNTEASGRFHTDWLNMMYPRLALARNLLSVNGLIVISIDDNEVGNLASIADEVFGEENHVSTIVWRRKRGKDNSAPFVSRSHEYLMIYARDVSQASLGRLPMSDETARAYGNPDGDSRGDYRLVAAWATGQKSGSNYAPRLGEVKLPLRKWVYSESTLMGFWSDGRLVLKGRNKTDGAPNVYLKVFKSESKGQIPDSVWLDAGNAADGADEVKGLFGGELLFGTVKPLKLIERVVSLATSGPDIVLDFFAGSATTAQAVMGLNSSDGEKRRFFMVQLPELTPDDSPAAQAGFKSVSDISRSRISLAGAKMRQGMESVADLDVGFRLFRLDHSNIRTWQPTGDLESDLVDSIEHILPDRSEHDVLTELLLKLGLDLCVPIEQREIASRTVHAIGGGVLMASLGGRIGRDDAEPLALGIAEWHRELDPVGDTTCVFRDSAFENDEAKTNLAAILEQHGIRHVRSL